VIPNSNPPVRFKLNHNSTRLQPGEPDTSIWVGDLSPDVDDYALYQFFAHRFQTVRCAKVVLDESGFSKGYGFVRFGSESEQQHALANMTGESGVGSKPIKVSMANQKSRAAAGGGAQGGMDNLQMTPMTPGRGHQNGSNGSWGSPLDGPMGAVSGPGGSATPSRGGGADSGWPGVQSQPTAAAAAAAWNQPTAAAATHIAAAAATHPDFSTYQHYYSQYAQQFSQQQQQYAAAWSAWQQQQP